MIKNEMIKEKLTLTLTPRLLPHAAALNSTTPFCPALPCLVLCLLAVAPTPTLTDGVDESINGIRIRVD